MDDAELDEQASRMADQFMGVMQERGVTMVGAARLEALEEIRQRVADGWYAYRAPGEEQWRHRYRGFEPMHSEMAAVLWPSTEEDVVTQSERQEDR